MPHPTVEPDHPGSEAFVRGRPKVDLGPLVIASDYDWADQRGARALRPEARSEVLTGPRLARLVVIRESDRYDRIMFDGLLRQSWARNHEAPGLKVIRRAGTDPLYKPESCPFDVVPITGEGFRASFFIVGDTGWVYSPASAKTSNSRGDNEFTATLCALIAEHRPEVVDAVAFTRLVRSLDHGPRLGAVCGQFVDRVYAGTEVLDFKENPAWSQFLWVFLSAMSSASRDEIQRQHVAGILTQHSRGEWLIEEKDLPFGYVYLPGTKTLKPDPSKRLAVQEMLRVLVSDLPQSSKITRLIDLEVLRRRPASAASALRTRIRWIPLYVNGVWIQRYANPFPGLDELVGMPVVGSVGTDPGYFELVYEAGLPAGGWADEPLLIAAMALLRRTQERRIGGKRSRHGLVGYQWQARIGQRRGARQWRIMVAGHQLEVRVRPRVGP